MELTERFRQALDYAARLHAGSVEVEVTVHACGADAVPVAFGFHPYLSLPGATRERLKVALPAMRRLVPHASQIPTGVAEDFSAQRFELGDRTFDDGFDRVPAAVAFSVADVARRIELTLLEGYPCAQVYAPPLESFVCFEPMTAPVNALCSGSGLRLLQPGERHRARFSIGIQDLQ